MSEGLHYDRIQQGHVLSSSDRQLVCSVVVDDLWDGGERRAVLSKHVTPLCRPSELHVHEALTAPDRERRKKKKRSTSSPIWFTPKNAVTFTEGNWKFVPVGFVFTRNHNAPAGTCWCAWVILVWITAFWFLKINQESGKMGNSSLNVGEIIACQISQWQTKTHLRAKCYRKPEVEPIQRVWNFGQTEILHFHQSQTWE